MKIRSLFRWSLFAITLFWVAVIASSSFSAREQNPAISKISPWVLERTANGAQAEFLIALTDQADLKGAEALTTKEAKGRFVRDALWNKAQQTQGPLLDWLTAHKVEHRSYYIVNLIWVKATQEVALALASRPDVARIEGNPSIRNVPEPLPADQVTESLPLPYAPTAIEPGISYTHAPDVWATGFNGQGIVVAGADTGIRWTHNALKPHYRGWDGAVANHDYNWHDAIHVAGSSCGADSPQPCDDNGHGTHTIGTAVGDDGAGNQIGMAPGAKFIGCRNMDQGNGTPARYIECMEFFLAPYPVGGTPSQGDSAKAPDITTNSWGCPASEGCVANSLQAAVEAQRAAGIMMVVAAGNSGSSCSTVSDPPSFYAASYTVGALNTGADTIASFSSRGPITADGSMRRKPDLSAPGTNTRSSYRTSDTSYANLSGTSMATPHVAGGIAVLLSARNGLRRDPADIASALNQSAAHILASTCDGGGTPISPNNTFGYGRLNVQDAVNGVLQITSAVSRKVHGSAGTFDIPLPLTGEPGVECRNSGGNDTIVLTFSGAVVSGSASVSGGTGTVMSSSVSGNTMTIELSGVSDVQKVTVTLSGVTGSGSQFLPTTSLSMNVLAGDVNASKSVSSSNVAQIKAQAGNVDGTNFRSDVAVSGVINSTDIGLTKSLVGHSVP
ncbi:MAG: S8 family serine peptidase [Chthoniobacterales bacterium]